MHNIEIFRPLQVALTELIKAQREEAKIVRPWAGRVRINAEQRLANKALILLVPVKRNLDKMFTAARVGHRTKVPLAGHRLVALLFQEFIMGRNTDYPQEHPIWNLPLTHEVLAVLYHFTNPAAEGHRAVFDWRGVSKDKLELALQDTTSATLAGLEKSFRTKLLAAARDRRQKKQALMEKLKAYLTPEEFALLLDKSI